GKAISCPSARAARALARRPSRERGRGMPKKPQTGDRVRVTTRTAVPDYLPGDKGTVLRGPEPSDGGVPAYLVAMDFPAGTGVVLSTEEEIGVDGWPARPGAGRFCPCPRPTSSRSFGSSPPPSAP